MRRAFLSTCVQSYGVCAQASRLPADLQHSCAAPMLAAHTQASGVNPLRDGTAHGPSSPQTDANSQLDRVNGKRASRWRIVDSSDLRSVNKSNGKLEDFSSSQLIPALAAKQWPEMSVSSHTQTDENIKWRNVITESFQDHAGVELVELNVCDLAICKVWPFKGMLLNASKAQNKPRTALTKMSTRRVHYFGDEKVAVDGLGMSNRLTGYVFLVDEDGRVRWQASGRMQEDEAHSFLRAVRALLGARKRDTVTDSEYGDTDSFSC